MDFLLYERKRLIKLRTDRTDLAANKSFSSLNCPHRFIFAYLNLNIYLAIVVLLLISKC